MERRVTLSATEQALLEAIELAQEGWGYVRPYSREMWKFEERIAKLWEALPEDCDTPLRRLRRKETA